MSIDEEDPIVLVDDFGNKITESMLDNIVLGTHNKMKEKQMDNKAKLITEVKELLIFGKGVNNGVNEMRGTSFQNLYNEGVNDFGNAILEGLDLSENQLLKLKKVLSNFIAEDLNTAIDGVLGK